MSFVGLKAIGVTQSVRLKRDCLKFLWSLFSFLESEGVVLDGPGDAREGPGRPWGAFRHRGQREQRQRRVVDLPVHARVAGPGGRPGRVPDERPKQQVGLARLLLVLDVVVVVELAALQAQPFNLLEDRVEVAVSGLLKLPVAHPNAGPCKIVAPAARSPR